MGTRQALPGGAGGLASSARNIEPILILSSLQIAVEITAYAVADHSLCRRGGSCPDVTSDCTSELSRYGCIILPDMERQKLGSWAISPGMRWPPASWCDWVLQQMGDRLGCSHVLKLTVRLCFRNASDASTGVLRLDGGRMAETSELGGTEDGYMNSYAYTLVIIHYMQSTSPPVVPNLHQLGHGSAPVLVVDMGQRG